MAIKKENIQSLSESVSKSWAEAQGEEDMARIKANMVILENFETTNEWRDFKDSVEVLFGDGPSIDTGSVLRNMDKEIEQYRLDGKGGHMLRWLDAAGYQLPKKMNLMDEPEWAAFQLALGNTTNRWEDIQPSIVNLITDLQLASDTGAILVALVEFARSLKK